MGLTGTTSDYLAQLQNLLPPGPVWPRDRDATLTKLLKAAADELSRVHQRSLALLEEADPRSTSELGLDWERVAGLPDECDPGEGLTFAQRRDRIFQKITSRGGQSPSFYISVASALGIPITITEFRETQFDRATFDERFNDNPWAFTWQVNLPQALITSAEFDSSDFTERFRDFGNTVLQCVLNKLKPAHTIIIFALTPMLLDYGRVTQQVGETLDFGLVTDAVGNTIDYGTLS